jgi:hypothetical protein
MGTLVFMLEGVAPATRESARLNLTALLAADGWKFLPAIVTAVPELANVGVKPVMLGGLEATTKGLLLEAEPAGAVTVMGPIVAPEGTVVTISVNEADRTVA